MVKRHFLVLIILSLLILKSFAQVPVINSITGPSVGCSAPGAPLNYSVSASNSPTSYSWSVISPTPGVSMGSPTSATTTISFPYSNGTYTIYCYAINGFGSSSTTSFVVNVFETPTVTFSGSNYFCSGSSTILQASSTILPGSSTISYNWTPNGGINLPNAGTVIANPSVTTTYTVTGTIGFCSNSSQITVSVLPNPTLSLNITNTVICLGNTLALTATGANTYSWSGGIINGVNFTPTISTNYSLVGTGINTCTSNAVSSIVVNPSLSVLANTTNSMICNGNSTTLFGTGATSYTWSSGVIDGSLFTPTTTATYTVNGSSPSCAGTASAVITVTVNPNPIINAVSNPSMICEGESVTVTISGSASSYSFNGIPTSTTISISPTITTIYTVTGSNAFGCISTQTLVQNVSTCVDIKQIYSSKNIYLLAYPNPNNGSFNLKSSNAETVFIINELGQIIESVKLEPDTETKIKGLINGCYFIKASFNRIKIIVMQL